MIVDRDGDFNFALATCAPTLLAAVLVGVQLSEGRVELGLLVPALVIAAIYAASTVYFIVEQLSEDRFRAWLLSSVAEIERGEAKYGELPITPTTELRVFQVPVSMVFLTYDVRLRPRIAGEEHTQVARISGAISLVTGWWFWSAVFRTPGLAWRNFRGGTPMTVAEYHAELIANGTAGRFARQ